MSTFYNKSVFSSSSASAAASLELESSPKKFPRILDVNVFNEARQKTLNCKHPESGPINVYREVEIFDLHFMHIFSVSGVKCSLDFGRKQDTI